jgi:hypothetical protein
MANGCLLHRLVFAVCTAALAGGAPAADVGELEGLVGRWVELRQQRAAEKRDWAAQQRKWQEEIRLLTAEQAALEAALKETASTASEAEERRAQLLARETLLDDVQGALLPLVENAEDALRRWSVRVPASLSERLRQALRQLPADGGRKGRETLTRRLQVVIAAYTEIESIQHGIHTVREVIALPGARGREMDVLYLGLARGFAVAPDDSWAAVGAPGSGGWTWAAAPALAPEVRKAVAIFNRQDPAEFVTLPLEVDDPKEGTP